MLRYALLEFTSISIAIVSTEAHAPNQSRLLRPQLSLPPPSWSVFPIAVALILGDVGCDQNADVDVLRERIEGRRLGARSADE